ncbi:MAG: ubiquinol-cytochrome c reductase iron-sulfur subunit [Chloroflexi bacterium]|nr:ubiquinol-cytochrome c reductase iron-sulfur subunit [Chloroflexota bacterium]
MKQDYENISQEESLAPGHQPGPLPTDVRDLHVWDNTPEAINRRKFLTQLSIALGGLTGVALVVPVAAFIIAPLFKETEIKWQPVKVNGQAGTLDKFKVGDTIEVTFEDSSPVAWAGVTAQTAAWMRRVNDTEFTCFAVNCSHLGCPVSWLPGAQLFMCPCHGGVYYADGRVAAGPPPQALSHYETRINNGAVEVKATGVPIPTA